MVYELIAVSYTMLTVQSCNRSCAGHASSSTSQQQAAQTTAPAPAPGALWPSTQQIAAAAQYFKEEVAGAKQRPAVPAKKYVIPPEPFDMRRQHKQVRSSDLTCSVVQAVCLCFAWVGQAAVLPLQQGWHRC